MEEKTVIEFDRDGFFDAVALLLFSQRLKPADSMLVVDEADRHR